MKSLHTLFTIIVVLTIMVSMIHAQQDKTLTVTKSLTSEWEDDWYCDYQQQMWSESTLDKIYGHDMAYCGGDTILLFGGHDSGILGDTYCWEATYKHWWWVEYFHEINPKPPSRYNHAMAYIGSDKVLLYGGTSKYGYPYGDTWIWDMSDHAWTEINPAASPESGRERHGMAYIGGDKVLLFGGSSIDCLTNGTWIYDLSEGNWTQKSPATAPSPRKDFGLAYLGGDKVLLFGGSTGWEYDDETWVYDLSLNSWTQMNPNPHPSARYSHEMVYIGNNQVVLYGGNMVKETWVYNLGDNTWIEDKNSAGYSENDPDYRYMFGFSESSMDGSSKPVLFGGLKGEWNKGGNDFYSWYYGGGDYLLNPLLSTNTSLLNFGTSSTSMTFQISNSGTGNLNWSITENPGKAWITSISPSSGTNNATITVEVNRSYLSGTSDTGTLSITSNGGSKNITVNISKELNPVFPVLSVDQTSMNFGTSSNSLTFQISNTGTGNLNWSITENPDKTWITSISPSSGTNNATITVQVDRSHLFGTSDTGTLSITSNGGNKDITVNISKEGEQPEVPEEPTGNIIDNWSFTNSMNDWEFGTMGSGSGTGTIENGVFHAQIQNGGSNTWDVNLHQFNLTIVNGHTYRATFYARAASSRNIKAYVGQTSDPYDIFNTNYNFSLTTNWQIYTFTFTMSYPTENGTATFGFDFGTSNVDVYLDNISLVEESEEAEEPEEPEEPAGNMVSNWSFSNGSDNWLLSVQQDAQAEASVQNGEYKVSITNGGSQDWYIQVIQDNLTITNGSEYQVTFDAYADSPREIVSTVLKSANPWTSFSGWIQFSLTTTKQTFTYSFTMQEPTCSIGAILFNVGESPINVYPDNISLVKTGSSSNVQLAETSQTARTFELYQNYPNPFNPVTTIRYQVPEPRFVSLKVYDLLGREVATLVNEESSLGAYEVEFNGASLPSGMYIYQLRTGEFTETRKLVVQK